MRQKLSFIVLLVCFFCIVSGPIFSQTAVGAVQGKVQSQNIQQQASSQEEGTKKKTYDPFTAGSFPYEHPSIVTQAITLSILSILPFLMMLLTSFAKISIVLALMRNALGTQQAPPNQVVNGISIIITLFIMFPTGIKMWDAAQPVIDSRAPTSLVSAEAAEYIIEVANAAKEPFRDFLINNSSANHVVRFYRMAYRVIPEGYRELLTKDDFIILIPSYVLSQLKGAFEVGVLVYLPFFVIDLVTSNILLAMGMMMLSPVTISLPLKIFLLVMLDGWTLLITGLVETYR